MRNKQVQGCTRGSSVTGGLADQVLLRAYTCLLQNTPIQACTQGSKFIRVWPTECCCERANTHMCCEHPNSQGLQGFGRPTATESMRTENSRRISQYRVVASRARVTKVWPTKCGLEHTHTRKLPWSGRLIAAASIHMCVAEKIS